MNLKNKIDYAYRALKTNRLCSWISIVGLGLGLACFMVIVKQVWQEYTTDSFHRNYHQMYCTVSQASEMDIPCLSEIINFSGRIADFPEVKAHTTVGAFEGEKLVVGEQVYKADILFARPGFFDVFDFPLLVGDTTMALRQTTDMLMTESFARKLFGKQDPLGKEIRFWDDVYKITGILKDVPINSSFHFDVLVPDRQDFSRMMSEFLVLKENCDIHSVKDRLKPEKFYGEQHFDYQFVPFAGLYFDNRITTDVFTLLRHGNKHSMGIFLITGIVIFLISLVNYLNIYQVALLRRDKELGVKRVLGEGFQALGVRFWIENLLMVICAVLLAIVVIGIAAGWIEQEWGLPVRWNLTFDIPLLLGILAFVPGIAVLFSLWRYRKFQPAMAMKSTGTTKKRTFARHVLLGIQYVMTLVMLVVSFYFIRQLEFMLNKDLGIKQENIIHAMLFKRPQVQSHWVEDQAEREVMEERRRVVHDEHEKRVEFVVNEIQRCPYVQRTSTGRSLLDCSNMPWKNKKTEGEFISCLLADITPEHLGLYGLKLKEGRFFDAEKDKGRERKIVINETARKKLGVTSLEETEIESESWGRGWKVIGVVEDFRVTHFSTPVAPMVMVYFGDIDENPYQMEVTVGKEEEVVNLLKGLYKKMEEPGELEYHFFEDEVRSLYVKDRKLTFLTIGFTLIAIFISSIGLFGFAYFDIRQRYREIGIRKVNGATTTEILILLFRRFMVLIVVAFVIALPIAWWIITRYRENFVESAPLSWWLFAAALVITGGVAWSTLLWQSRKAAKANPVESLKTE